MRPRARHDIKRPVTAIGDSVMLDAVPALRRTIPAITIDAAENRSALPGPGLLLAFAQSGTLGRSIVIDLGTNGGMSVSIVDAMLRIAAGRRVVMVTNHCLLQLDVRGNLIALHAPNNATVVADWDAPRASTWFASDGVHMPISGTGAMPCRPHPDGSEPNRRYSAEPVWPLNGGTSRKNCRARAGEFHSDHPVVFGTRRLGRVTGSQ
jgi:hypothetical protein